MSRPLHFPPDTPRPRRTRRFPGLRGRQARIRLREETEFRQRGREALLHTTLTCVTLWGGFWLQFLTGMLYNQPALHTLTGGFWFKPSPFFYLRCDAFLPFSIAGAFLALSALGVVLALAAAIHFTRHSPGRWRMRFAVLLFSTILLGWAAAAMAAKKREARQDCPVYHSPFAPPCELCGFAVNLQVSRERPNPVVGC